MLKAQFFKYQITNYVEWETLYTFLEDPFEHLLKGRLTEKYINIYSFQYTNA